MITRKMIENGLETGKITIEDHYQSCKNLCCKIGENAFYFIGMESFHYNTKTYWQSHTVEWTVDKIYSILKDQNTARENGIDHTEYKTYESILLPELSKENQIDRETIKQTLILKLQSSKSTCLTLDQDYSIYCQVLNPDNVWNMTIHISLLSSEFPFASLWETYSDIGDLQKFEEKMDQLLDCYEAEQKQLFLQQQEDSQIEKEE